MGLLSTAHVHTGGFASRLSAAEGVEFVGVTDDDAERGREAATEHDTEFYEPSELVERVDAVIVSSTNTTHRRWVELAADTGVHILCEKPLATNVADARAIVDACDEADVQLGLCMPLPFSVPARRAKAAYDAGEIGDLRVAVGTNRAWLRDRHLTGWSADPEHAGGGAAMDHTVHIVNLVRWITGEEVVEVFAELSTMHDELTVEDVNVLSMELSGGSVFTLDGSWDRPDDWDYWGDATLNLIGTEGEISVDCFDQTLKRTREGAGVDGVYWGSIPDDGLLRDFIDAIENDRPPLTSGDDGFREAAVVCAVYESNERDEPVAVEY
ncbi:xylose dehydrogenase Gfo6 [Halalkalicoccus paucihalophilus]|uniref:Xylose dehydrogenase Gfo6 n=1 Tax=Halalkalicoccus paucihalophilus TaxID=1008153 RepID=A0A151AA20_9EURY|nr:Gfo/Idh/MocA family oxidoreductase [Halalkalicoccus paucihalophilus]KYH24485.1 xylose dehydrogenase Gfo6 [Halalkalicoccus paucihalophilus]